MPDHITIQAQLTDQEAWDLAQFIKRSTFDTYRNCAVDQEEAYRMLSAAARVQAALREAGYAPR
jgi:cytochrome c